MKKRTKVLTAVLAILLVLGIIATAGFLHVRNHYILWNGLHLNPQGKHLNLKEKPMPEMEFFAQFPNLRSLDARGTGMTVEQYDALRSTYPQLTIRWDVPFQGGFLKSNVKKIKITSLKEEDLRNLTFLKEMTSIDAWDCEEYELLMQLQDMLPECDVLYSVNMGQQEFDCNNQRIVLRDGNGEEMLEKLRFLPNLTEVSLTDNLPSREMLEKNREAYPHIRFQWELRAFGQKLNQDMEELIIPGKRIDAVEEVDAVIPHMPQLKKVDMTDCQLDPEKMVDLAGRYPEIEFLFHLKIGSVKLTTDAEQINISNQQFDNIQQVKRYVNCFPNLKKVTMLDCGLSNGEMKALIKTYENIDFLWSVQLGDKVFPSDAKEIDISNCQLTSTQQAEEFAACFPNLEKMIMCDCGISNEDMDALNRKYENTRFVWSVQLGIKKIRTDAIHYVPSSWGEKCFDETIYNLRYCTDMVCVDVSHNEAVSNCDWAAFMPNLKYLVIAQTTIRDLTPLSGLKNLVYLEMFQCAVKDYTPLVTVTSLEDLNISYTFGEPEPIAQMTWLKRVWWSGSWKARNLLPEALPNTQLEFHELSSTGAGWREGQHYYDMRDLIGQDYLIG